MRRERNVMTIRGMCGVLLIVLVTNLFLSAVYAKEQYETAGFFVNWFMEEYPGDEMKIMEHMKAFEAGGVSSAGKDYLAVYGYDSREFGRSYRALAVALSVLGTAALYAVFTALYRLGERKKRARIEQITEYLVNVNTGGRVPLLPDTEDAFSGLEDEIYKTVTELKTTKEAAQKERQNFAKSLADIAHQIKTPVTAISMGIWSIREKLTAQEEEKLKKQLMRIDQLISALLTVSRIDAGVLRLKKTDVDVYTVMELSVEALEEQIKRKSLTVILPNHPEISFIGDPDWSVEAFTNLLKNSVEHTQEHGTIRIEYEKTPLYVEIVITDDGEGFDEKELPRLFWRFYRGGKRPASGTGIGLSVAKSVIEMQNGFLTAKNAETGGACFVARFYF